MSLYTRFVSAAMRATRPRSLAEARRTMRLAAAEWRRRRRPNPGRIRVSDIERRGNGYQAIATDTERAFGFQVGVGPTPAAAARDAESRMRAEARRMGYRRSPFGKVGARAAPAATQGGLFNPSRKKKRPTGGEWQPDLFGGAGIQRPEGATRAEQLALARQEMRDAGARDLFDVLAERQGNPGQIGGGRFRVSRVSPHDPAWQVWDDLLKRYVGQRQFTRRETERTARGLSARAKRFAEPNPNADLRELDRVARQLDRASRDATSLPTREERIRAHRRRERLTQRYRELSRNPRRRNPGGDSLLTYFLIGGLVYFFVVRGKGLDSVATPLGLNPFNQ